MKIEEAKHKLDYMKKAYQKLIDEKVDSGKLVGDGVSGEWKAETPLDEAYKSMIDALEMAIKALEQEPCEVSQGLVKDSQGFSQEPCEDVPDLYECPCGYGWDKNKVVRHHFCPNCGRAVDGSIKTEQEPCEDVVSRQAVIDTIDKWIKSMHVLIALPANEVTPLFESVHELPSVIPQQKMGRWIVLKDEFDDVCEAVCSCCDKNGNHKWAFCPFCGCKMQEVKDE